MNDQILEANYVALMGCVEIITKIKKHKTCSPEIETMIDTELKKLTDIMEKQMGVIKTPLKNGMEKWEFKK